MSDQFDLKSIERRAFRSTFEDGLWDMYLGLVMAAMAVFMYRPASGYSPLNIILAVLVTILAYNLYRAGKRYITLPRMGQVRFGPIRKRRKAVLAFVLGGLILLQVGVLLLTVFGWLNPDVSKELNATLIQNRLDGHGCRFHWCFIRWHRFEPGCLFQRCPTRLLQCLHGIAGCLPDGLAEPASLPAFPCQPGRLARAGALRPFSAKIPPAQRTGCPWVSLPKVLISPSWPGSTGWSMNRHAWR